MNTNDKQTRLAEDAGFDIEGVSIEQIDDSSTYEQSENDRLCREVEEVKERGRSIRAQARAVKRAYDGWGRVHSEAQWETVVAQAADDFESGTFVISCLGAERYLDPALLATLLGLRTRIMQELQVSSTIEMMLLDSAIANYYRFVRGHRWDGDLALLLEHEFFAQEGLSLKLRKRGYVIQGLSIEERIAGLRTELVALLELPHRMMLQDLKAISEFRGTNRAGIRVGTAGQVNVGTVQTNVAPPKQKRTRTRKSAKRGD